MDPSDLQRIEDLHSAFVNNGVAYDEDNDKFVTMNLKDALTTGEVNRFIPTVVTTIVREALEPAAVVVNNIFQSMELDRGRQVQIGSIGAMTVADIPEGSEYPEAFPDMGEGSIIATNVDKVGIQIHFTDEMIEDTQFDVIGLWLRAAGRAFARHKELKGLKLLDEMGIVVFDNDTGQTSIEGSCTGRNVAGDQNGSMTLNDVFQLYAYLVTRGFSPSHWITHPLAWTMFLTDPEIREIVMSGEVLSSNRIPAGAAGGGWPTEFNGMGQRTTATGEYNKNLDPTNVQGRNGANAFLNTLNPLGNTHNIPPKGLPSPLTMIVTPWMAYDATGGNLAAAAGLPSTAIAMVDASATGVLINRESLNIEEFDKPLADMHGLKLRERYGFMPIEQGKGVALAKNVILDRNYVFDNTNSVTLAALASTDFI
jgi:hypothetical protein